MYPASFDYQAPSTLEEALDVLGERGDDVKVLAGGQSLIPLMKLRFAQPAKLIDINRLPGLDFIDASNGYLRIGALVRHNDVAGSDVVRRTNHTVANAAPWISDPLVRNLGTVCGSLAHADPQGDWASVMLACGADVVARKKTGERVIPMTEFITDAFTTQLQPDELALGERDRLLHPFERLEPEPCPLLQAPPVRVGSLVVEARQELHGQVRVRAVDVDDVESAVASAPRSGDPVVLHPPDIAELHRLGYDVRFQIRGQLTRPQARHAGLVVGGVR